MQFSTVLTFAAVALSTTLGVNAAQKGRETTLWVPTATVVQTHTFTATRVEEVWATTAPFQWETTFPITFTQTQTVTQFQPVVTVVQKRSHARDFETS